MKMRILRTKSCPITTSATKTKNKKILQTKNTKNTLRESKRIKKLEIMRSRMERPPNLRSIEGISNKIYSTKRLIELKMTTIRTIPLKMQQRAE